MLLAYLQLMTFLFAVCLAWFQKFSVNKMIDHGASIKEEKQFHFASGLIKFIWIFRYAFIAGTSFWLSGLLVFVLLGANLWLVFDIALNKFTGKVTFYVGNTAKLDKWQRKHLGRYAGQIKAGVCLAVIVLLNVLYFLL
jgi:hypothetical protein